MIPDFAFVSKGAEAVIYAFVQIASAPISLKLFPNERRFEVCL